MNRRTGEEIPHRGKAHVGGIDLENFAGTKECQRPFLESTSPLGRKPILAKSKVVFPPRRRARNAAWARINE